MGIFDIFKDEFIEVIEWVESDGDTIMHKFPDRDRNIKYGAQLTVRESQVAIFVDEGQIADVYGPGRHKLFTDNMPIMTTLRSWKHGFDSPFKADVYFISTKQFPALKWGTPNPVMMRDPEFKQVRVKAFGTYFVRVSDPKTFFTEFAGTKPNVHMNEVEAKMRDLIAPKFAESLSEAGISVLDMATQYSELGEKILPLIQADFEPFGIELTKFQITSTSLPKEVEAFYDKMTNMNMVDDMGQFTRFQGANAIEKAASNPGGGAGDGVGMGVGFGMAKMFTEGMGNTSQSGSESAADAKAKVIDLLKELGQLKEQGILTQEEFDAKKKELLAKL